MPLVVWKSRRVLIGAAVLMVMATAHAAAPASSVDLRPIFSNWGLTVRGQGARGTCSVFTVTEALEYAFAVQHHGATRFSVEFLNWASNQALGQAEDGGFFSDLWKGFAAYGICPETDLAYQATFDADLKPSGAALEHAQPLRDAGLELHWIKPWDVTTGLTPAHLESIKDTLRRQWPVCGGFRWPKQERWHDNILEMAPPEGVRDGHSVLLVGFRDDPAQPGGGVFIFLNSGKSAAGDGYMTYEYASAYMNDAAWIGSTAGAPTTQPAAATHATNMSARELLSPMTGLVGRNRRVSSNEQPAWHTENLDMNWLQPGQKLELPLLQGPGVITHMWFTSHAGWVGELNALSLRIYWDDRAEPGIEVPLGDFFAVGGKPAVVESVPVQVSPTGALTCFWRMPFQKSARIVITNDNPERSTGLYWQVDWMQVDALPPETPYFHARYRCEYPAVMDRDYTFAELEGRGQYVGTVLSVTLAQDGWFGEGDDFFYIDGEEVPSLQGTGSEDYFNDAWGFRPRTSHWFGSPRWQGDAAGDSGVCYRWHLPDPINFTRSLQATIEHKGNRPEATEAFFIERPDFLSSVAFWYQTGAPKPWPPLPAWAERQIPWDEHYLVKLLHQAQSTGTAKVTVDTSGLFGARPVLSWPNREAGSELKLPFSVSADGRYALRLSAGTGPDCGNYDIAIDGQQVLTATLRAGEADETDLVLGTHALTKGDHTLSLRATTDVIGPLAVEKLRLLKLPPEANRQVRTHHEAHFVRLGIGRAVYAYRLIYGKVPDSLEALVKSGIMPERYLNDENNRPLRSHREGERLIVESTGAEPWTHSWQGFDARR